MVHAAFQEGMLPEEETWKAVFLIPKGGGEYRCIGLVEVVWKVVTVIIDCRFTASTSFHDILHGFQVVCGTGTTCLEAKLIHQLTVIREEFLCTIFLGLNKPYDTLDRDI